MSRTDRVSHVANWLERAILSGDLAPGDALPSEREISGRLDVSRSVVREAIGRLASLGLVRSIHGSGTRVQAPNTRQVTIGYQRLLHHQDLRLQDLAGVRLPLEAAIAELAAQHRTDEHLARLEKTQKVLGYPRRSLETHAKADLEFHATLAAATGNPLFATMLAPIQELLIASRRRTLGRYGSELAYEHHGRILDAVRAMDPQAARAAMEYHMRANIAHIAPAPESEG